MFRRKSKTKTSSFDARFRAETKFTRVCTQTRVQLFILDSGATWQYVNVIERVHTIVFLCVFVVWLGLITIFHSYALRYEVGFPYK